MQEQYAKTITIVVPVFNESAAIEHNLSEILAQLEQGLEAGGIRFHILVIDDGSGDDTASKVKALCEQRPNIELLCQPCQGGINSL